MTPAELLALADAATPWQVGGKRSAASSQADYRLAALAPDLARLCAELDEALGELMRRYRDVPQEADMIAARIARAKLAELEAPK